jgi:hypothetical protein
LGSFVFTNVDFVDITVNREGSCVISASISSSKTCEIENCRFSGGCLGKGDVILVKSDIVPSSDSLIVKKSNFTSCYGYNGGVFRYVAE